jgi:type IV pilus assembly protein PilV
MVAIRRSLPRYAQQGTTLLEVLITIVLLAIGLLGLAGLQTRMQSSEMEAYQRSQALILLDDMASRIATNRNNAASYTTGAGSPFGAGMTCPTDTSTRQKADAVEWCNALQGAAEAAGGSNLGAMVGGRGCVEDLGGGQFLVTVAWQGMTPLTLTGAPASACGQNSYDNAGACAGDLCRRIVTTIVRIATLS